MTETPPARQRLDTLLVALGHVPSRARASDAIKRGRVSVDGQPVTKPGALVEPDAAISCDDPANVYVSRAALKLVAGLGAFGFEARGRQTVDLGASTGGFTEVLLERGAARVLALDVGHDQLHPRLRADPRVDVREGFNARDLVAADLDFAPEAIVCDVSFISLKLVLPPILPLAAPGAWGVFLIKPQFEVGRDHVGKGGIVRDDAVAARVVDELRLWLDRLPGWRVAGLIPSPIEGSDGNREFVIGVVRDGA